MKKTIANTLKVGAAALFLVAATGCATTKEVEAAKAAADSAAQAAAAAQKAADAASSSAAGAKSSADAKEGGDCALQTAGCVSQPVFPPAFGADHLPHRPAIRKQRHTW